MKSHLLAPLSLLSVVACATDPEPAPDPTLTARFSTATHDQLGITLYAAADLVEVALYKYVLFASSITNDRCQRNGTPDDITFVTCGALAGSARAQNSSLRWPREGVLADAARPEILTANALRVDPVTAFDGRVERSSPAGAPELGRDVAIESALRFEHPWGNSESALQLTELPDAVEPWVHYIIADTSRISVDGVGRAAVSGELRVRPAELGSGYDMDGWLELRGAETLRATLHPAEECTALSIDGADAAPLCRW